MATSRSGRLNFCTISQRITCSRRPACPPKLWRRRMGDAFRVYHSHPLRFAQRNGYRFVTAAKGRIDNASASFTFRLRRGTGRHVKRSCAPFSENVSGNSIVVSCHRSRIGGKPTREDSRGAITTIHLSARYRAKLKQHSAKVPLAQSGRYSPRWKRSGYWRRNRSSRWVRNNLIRPSGQVCINSPGVAVANVSSISRRRL